ncbi:MAG: putative DNA ligase [Candidatus Curtissbacteria bacterium GW2011_GWA1_40_16]|uniref:Probable DNA ligase n=1 Tax=Candidatus Curtissbacteria bacterium GW2011_GWA1_40_16 TaxID=1618405 RepID=A0A0G0TSY8_9BACT|nr:MAG: putative DNA ligase [Candidatus Curtissbacteria bacterium GW2011_GWA1_40_16]
MKFSKLAEYYEKLEATSKRLELVDILSKLFGESDSAEIGKICYLIQGRVAPFYMPVELGMAESMVAQAIGKAYGKTKEDVIKSYRHLGNIGLAAQELAKNHKASANLTVSDVFGELRKIADLGGEGSVEKKISMLAQVLKDLDSVSVKHVVNIPLGTLRLGIGDPTVMDALSIAKTGDKKLRPIIEDAYNKTSDLGYVAEEFFRHGEKGLSTIKLIVGKPVRPALAERMPNADEVVKRMGDKFAAEPKFDGFRVQIHLDRSQKLFSGPVSSFPPASAQSRQKKDGKGEDNVDLRAVGSPSIAATRKDYLNVRIFSRNLEDMTHSFPDLAQGVLKEVRAKSVIMEGEAIAYNPETEEFLPFQETTKRRRKYKIEETAKALPLVCFAFDILYLDGEDITGKPEIERRKLLEKIVSKNNQTIRIAEQRVITTAKEIQEFFNEAISDGLEGLMIKKLDAPYKAGGRGFHWIKFKRASSGDLADTVDCVLLGIYTGRGKRTEFGVGGLLVGIYNDKDDVFETISRVGTGLTDEEFRKVHEIGKKLRLDRKPARVKSKIEPSYWVEPKEVLEIYADEITKSPIHTAGEVDGIGYALRFPRLVKFREADKRPEDSTTVSEIKKLYEMQYKKK